MNQRSAQVILVTLCVPMLTFCVPSESRGNETVTPDETRAAMSEESENSSTERPEVDATSGSATSVASTDDAAADAERRDALIDPVSERGQRARGMYITGPFVRVLGVDAIKDRMRAARLDAAVIDMKDGAGRVTYDTQIEILEPQQRNFLGDVRALVQTLKDDGIYTIARIVCFADPQLPGRHPERAIMDNRPGRRTRAWRSWGTAGTWLDPYNTDNHDLVIELAKEAESFGFDEVQLDYVRWPVDDGTQYAHYPAMTEDSPERYLVLRDFLRRMDEQLHIPIGVDVFGLTAFDFGNQLPLGQKLDAWVDYVEVICPMLYLNSMKTWGLGQSQRDRQLIEAGISQLRRRIGPRPILRPYLQAFAEGADDPGPGFIARQIIGARHGGADGYLFWHPGSRYNMLYQAASGVARDVNRPFSLGNRAEARRQAVGLHPEDAENAEATRRAEAPRPPGAPEERVR